MPQFDFIADTSAIIRRLRKGPLIEPFFAGRRFAISFVTLAELGVGVLKSNHPEAAWTRVLEVLGGVPMFRVSELTRSSTQEFIATWNDVVRLFQSTTSGSPQFVWRRSFPSWRAIHISTAFPASR